MHNKQKTKTILLSLGCEVGVNAILSNELNVPQAECEGGAAVAILVDKGVGVELVHCSWGVEHEALALKVADGVPETNVENSSCHVASHVALDMCNLVATDNMVVLERHLRCWKIVERRVENTIYLLEM